MAFAANNKPLLERVGSALNDAKFEKLLAIELASEEIDLNSDHQEVTLLIRTLLPRSYSRGLLWFRLYKKSEDISTLGEREYILRPKYGLS